MRPIRILSIDGGGIRGILPAVLLKELIGERPVGDFFDIVAGTSTGGLIAAGLCKPKPLTPTRILDIYKTRGADIFSRKGWIPAGLAGLFGPKYTAEGLESVICDLVGDAMLSEVTGPELLIASYCVDLAVPKPNGDTQAPFFFRSAPAAAGDAAYDFRLRDICRATSAAPTYFPAARATSALGETYGFIDGGVFANNPAMCALTHAFHQNRDRKDARYLLVSLGTGATQAELPYRTVRNWGAVRWVEPLIQVLMDGNSDTVDYELGQMLQRGTDFWRFDIALNSPGSSASSKMDDTSPKNINALMQLAMQMVDRNREAIAAARAALLGPWDAGAA